MKVDRRRSCSFRVCGLTFRSNLSKTMTTPRRQLSPMSSGLIRTCHFSRKVCSAQSSRINARLVRNLSQPLALGCHAPLQRPRQLIALVSEQEGYVKTRSPLHWIRSTISASFGVKDPDAPKGLWWEIDLIFVFLAAVAALGVIAWIEL